MITAEDQSSPVVGEILPENSPPVEPLRRVPFTKGLLLYWLLPGRYGPHLAAGSFRRAFAAHVIALVVLAGLAVAPTLDLLKDVRRERLRHEPTHDTVFLSSFEKGRAQIAEGVIEASLWSANSGLGWTIPAGIIAGPIMVEAAWIILAALLMPLAAGGDSASSVFKRSLKNMYWATTVIIPVVATALWLRPWEFNSFHALREIEPVTVMYLTLWGLLAPALLLRAAVTGARRYVGEPQGPAFAPRQPRCEQCGYLIVGLEIKSSCPECGSPVRDSLPGGRQRPTRWQQPELRKNLLELLKLQRRGLFDPGFFRELPVHDGLPAARHFWWSTFWLMVFTGVALAGLLTHFVFNTRSPTVSTVLVLILLPPLLISAQLLFMFAGCMWSQFRYGIRDYRVSAIVSYYASPLMWPMLVVLLLVLVLEASPLTSRIDRWDRIGFPDGISMDGSVAACWLLSLAALGFWWSRLRAALWAVRFANV